MNGIDRMIEIAKTRVEAYQKNYEAMKMLGDTAQMHIYDGRWKEAGEMLEMLQNEKLMAEMGITE